MSNPMTDDNAKMYQTTCPECGKTVLSFYTGKWHCTCGWTRNEYIVSIVNYPVHREWSIRGKHNSYDITAMQNGYMAWDCTIDAQVRNPANPDGDSLFNSFKDALGFIEQMEITTDIVEEIIREEKQNG